MDERRENNIKILDFISKSKVKLEYIHTDICELKTVVSKQNGRIFKLEIWQARLFGACTLIGILITILNIVSLWIRR